MRELALVFFLSSCDGSGSPHPRDLQKEKKQLFSDEVYRSMVLTDGVGKGAPKKIVVCVQSQGVSVQIALLALA